MDTKRDAPDTSAITLSAGHALLLNFAPETAYNYANGR